MGSVFILYLTVAGHPVSTDLLILFNKILSSKYNYCQIFSFTKLTLANRIIFKREKRRKRLCRSTDVLTLEENFGKTFGQD